MPKYSCEKTRKFDPPFRRHEMFARKLFKMATPQLVTGLSLDEAEFDIECDRGERHSRKCVIRVVIVRCLRPGSHYGQAVRIPANRADFFMSALHIAHREALV